MSSPPKDRTVIEPDVGITGNPREVPGVEVSTIVGSLPLGASTKVTTKDTSIRIPAASPVLCKVDGVWKRTVQILMTRKAHVDSVCPIAKTAYVYYDEEVYDSTLTENSTGITYVTQLIFDNATEVYYVYHRWGESIYELDGPHETVDSAKETFQATYKERFDVEWTERESTTSERWTYDVKTYEIFEEIGEIEEVVGEAEAIAYFRSKEIVVEDTQITEATITAVAIEDVTLDHGTREETFVVKEDCETVNEVLVTTETGVLIQPAVSEKSSWFRRVLSGAGAVACGGAVAGAGAVACGAASGAAGVAPEGDHDPFALEKTPPAGGKKGGSAGLSPIAIAAVMDASRM